MAAANITDLIFTVTGIITLATSVLGALALFVFLKGLVKFISQSGDAGSHKEGKDLMIWGIIALFIMVSFLSIIGLAKKIFGTDIRTGIPLIERNK